MITKKYWFVAPLILAALTPTESFSRPPIVIAVIDTGIDSKIPNLCKFGHKSFVDNSPLTDQAGHGTHIAGLINRTIGKELGGIENYCIVSIKWYDSIHKGNSEGKLKRAIQYAVNINVKYMNISGGGNYPDSEEETIVQRALNKGITIAAAAGNDDEDLDKFCNYFPACYDNRIVTVGNLQNSKIKSRQPSSNYGHYIKKWEVGTNVLSDLPDGHRGYMTGTSQATAIITGKLVRSRLAK